MTAALFCPDRNNVAVYTLRGSLKLRKSPLQFYSIVRCGKESGPRGELRLAEISTISG